MFGIRIVHGAPLTDEVDGGGVLSVCRAEEGVSFGSESWICVLLLVQPAGHSIQYRDCTLVGRPVVEKEKREEGRHAPTTHTTHSPSVCSPSAGRSLEIGLIIGVALPPASPSGSLRRFLTGRRPPDHSSVVPLSGVA